MALNSYTAQGAAGNAIGDFIDTYLKAKQMKQQQDYQAQALGLNAAEKGLVKNDATGAYEPSPLTAAKQQEAMQDYAKTGSLHDAYYKAAQSQSKRIDKDNVDLPTDLTNKELSKYMADTKPQQSAVVSMAGQDMKGDFYRGMIDDKVESQHQKNISRIENNTNVKNKINQYQNIQGALNNFAAADKKTPQAVDELQQTIRANLGIKGTSGVGEREKDYFNSLGLNADRMSQFLTGNPADIAADNGIVQHISQLANLESKNINTQMDKALESAGSGNASFYKKHPEKLEDLKDYMAHKKGQVGGDQQAGLVQAAPTGLVQEAQAPQQGGGIIDSIKGLLGGGQAPATAAPAADISKMSRADKEAMARKMMGGQ